MCDPVSAVAIGSAVIGAGTSVYTASKQRKAARKARTANEAAAMKQAQRSEEEFNRANQRQPDLPGMSSANRQRAGQGVGSTFLTGPSGVNPALLPLGGINLLGQ